jgi:hypothetical protein
MSAGGSRPQAASASEGVVTVSDESSPREVEEVTMVQAERATFEGSSYDAGLSLDTTPTSRVQWDPERQSEQRSAYDTKMIADATPTMRWEPAAPSSGTEGVSAASGDE